MENLYDVMGDFTNQGSFLIETNSSPIQILKQLDLNSIDNRKIIGVQIGGVLGKIAFGKEMIEPLSYRLDDLSTNHLLFFSDLFCPVDYLRFLSRFLIREIGIDTDETRNLNDSIENITLGNSYYDVLKNINNILCNLGKTVAEKRIRELYYQIIERFKDDILEHIQDKNCKTGICRTLITAQCINACPAHVHIPGYVSLMKKGDFNKAYALMRKTNPLSLICGKICARPCEDRCRRKEIESTVGVRALQRYASSHALNNKNFTEEKLSPNGKTIGIIGAGPAGLTSAYYLQRSGYQVDIYEETNFAGGMLSSCVPKYRMPYEDLSLEIKTITDLGVNIKYNHCVGLGIKFEDIHDRYDAVIIAVGAKFGKKLEFANNKNTETAVDFLRSVRLCNRKEVSEYVVVLGGGDVALDVARTAVRLGAKTVTVVSLEKFEDMPANYDDRLNSLKEGVLFENGYGISSCTNEGELTLEKCLSVIDLEGDFSPIFSKTEQKYLKSDQLILAVGQYPDISFLNPNIKIKKGFICTDKNTGITSLPNVYAVGDVVENGIAIKAIANAKKIAEKIDMELGGKGIYIGENIEIPDEPLKITTWDDSIRLEQTREINEIKGDFEELVYTFEEKDALYEANRCMRCDRNSLQPLWLRPRNSNC